MDLLKELLLVAKKKKLNSLREFEEELRTKAQDHHLFQNRPTNKLNSAKVTARFQSTFKNSIKKKLTKNSNRRSKLKTPNVLKAPAEWTNKKDSTCLKN